MEAEVVRGSYEHGPMGKGITLTVEEAEKLKELL